MMQQSESQRAQFAYEHSLEWISSPFRGKEKVFMILSTYADESYYDNGKSIVIVVAGWLVTEKKWTQFVQSWQKVLDEFIEVDDRYFHFAEYADKNHKSYDKTPYDGWSELKRENFLYRLALVACDCGFPVGGACPTEKLTAESIKTAYRTFLASVAQTFKTVGETGDKVSFVFDSNEDNTWLIPRKEALEEFRANGAPFTSGFDMKCPKEFLHLQAADLYAYAIRQNGERFYGENTKQPAQPRILDLILEKNRHDLNNRNDFDLESWSKLMKNVIGHYREWKRSNPKGQYRPYLHHPLIKQAMTP